MGQFTVVVWRILHGRECQTGLGASRVAGPGWSARFACVCERVNVRATLAARACSASRRGVMYATGEFCGSALVTEGRRDGPQQR